MTLQRKLGSLDSREIKSALLELLNVETDKDVLECDDAFYAAADKHSYLARFESSTKGERPLKSPELLERWMHYCWLRAQVSFLANQKSSLNKIGQIQEETALASANKKAMPALTHSVARAIQEDAENQVPIENSISLLRKVTLQIVGTEHPTDPLSQPALEALNRLANAISDEESSHKSLRKIFAELRQVDPIPPFHRDVVEEVNRNIGITLDKLYDSLPDFINTIFAAYKTYYGAELYAQHENEICIALTGGVQPDGTITRPIVSDASWPGFDADGNINMTAEVMRSAIRLHRIRIAEKHSETLTNNAISISKEIERKLRREITDTNIRILTDMILTTDDKNILTEISTATLKVSQGMMDKMFTNVLSLFNNLDLYLPTLGIAFYEKNPSLFFRV
jgi:phosphoenolpyruvate carboxylase